MEYMFIILIVVVFSVLVFTIWNIISLRELKSSRNYKELNDPRYYELKYKMEFLVAVFSIIVSLVGLLGYNSIQNAKDEVKISLNKDLDSIQTNLSAIEKTINEKDSLVKNLIAKTNYLNDDISTSASKVKVQNKELNLLRRRIEIINDKNILKKNFYVISSIKYKNTGPPKAYSFKSLTTSNGDRLPEFKFPPVVIPANESSNLLEVIKVTTEEFTISSTGFSTDESNSDTLKASFIIIEK